MALCREQIEHLEHYWNNNDSEKFWKNWSHSRKWLKKQMNRFLRRQPIPDIEDDDISNIKMVPQKKKTKPTIGWEY